MNRRARGPVDPRLLRHARTSRAGIAALAVIGAAQAAATVVLAVVLTGLVARDAGLWAFAALAGVYAARAALIWAEQVVGRRTAARVTDELRRSVLSAALRRGPAWVAGYGTGRLVAVLSGGLDALRPWFSGYLPALVLGAALPPLVVATMLVVDPASAVIVLVTLPLVPLLGALIGWATARRAQDRWQASARLAGHFLDAVRGIATLRLFGRADRQIDTVRRMTDGHRAATVRVLRVAFLSSTALDLIGTLSVGLVAVEAGLRVAAGRLDLAPALLVILLAPEAYRPLREVAARFHASADAAAVIADVDEILTPAPSPSVAASVATASVAAAPGVAAVGVRVRHPGVGVDALRLPALTVHSGELVALRGPSGAGKTTALRVLAGLQPVLDGSVFVGGGGRCTCRRTRACRTHAASPRRSRWTGSRDPTTAWCSPRCARSASTPRSSRCRAGSTRRSANAARACPPASGSGSPWPGCCARPAQARPSSCWTNPPPTSMPPPNAWSSRSCGPWPRGGARSSS